MLVAPGLAQAASPPPNPTDNQINHAAAAKAALAGQVGELGAKVADMQSQLQQLQAAQEMAEQKFAYAQSKYQEATENAAAAAAAITRARTKVDDAQNSLRAYAAAAFMNGGVTGDAGALLTAPDPSALLQQSALQSYESDHQLDALSQVQAASVGQSNAEAAARKAKVVQAKAKADATTAKNAADAAVIAAQAQQHQLQQTLASTQTQLSAAQRELAGLNHQRAQYDAYVAEQKRLAIARAKAAAARAAAARLAAARAAAAAAEAAKHHQGGGGGGSVSVGPPSGGTWTAARGQAAVNKAMNYRGWMYAWAGGNRSGPTYGVCAGDGAFNDCHVIGFDCSGLALYAWGKYINLDHYAATQYSQAGSYHPSTNNLLPGDLVFWSSDGSQSGIHHVAIYIGGGNVLQAPQSGEVIQITPLDEVDWGYYGATRPLT
jgi:cell wall-associated NlpC family hydrolase